MKDEVLEVLESCYRANIPIFLWGPPAIGKTARVKELAKNLKVPIITLVISQMDAVDLAGAPIPLPGERKLKWMLPAWFPDDMDMEGILLLDDLGQAPELNQAVTMELLWARQLHGNILPLNLRMIVTSNRPEDRARGF